MSNLPSGGPSQRAAAHGSPVTVGLFPMTTDEIRFRTGACHAARWLRQETRKIMADGKTAEHISAVLGDWVQGPLDWREGKVQMPRGNPWEWGKRALAHYISSRKSEW